MPQACRRSSFAPPVRRAFLATICALAAFACRDASAGGGPENVFVVVNERSWASLTIANHYVRLRQIPPSNVLYLDWSDDNERIDAETARRKLIGPIMAEIRRRGIADHIDYVVYSSDFPWLVDCSSDPTPEPLPAVADPRASLTGVTYFHNWFLQRRADFRFFRANGYYRPTDGLAPPKSHGFRSWYGWNETGDLLEAGGMNYMLSAMLGVTSGRGNSVDEVVGALIASVGADYEKPPGTVYFMRNADVRSTTRSTWFEPAVDAIAEEGGRAQIAEGIMPAGKRDIIALMLGTPNFSFQEARSKLLPGAIAENLTSAGGDLSFGAGQTPISQFVRAGSALTSGAVFEPFAVAQKFPTAFMPLHYLRGCSAAEAFYQATNGPYQLLVLGDPLCRPFAPRATITMAGLEDGQKLAGKIRFAASGEFAGGATAARTELYIDGLLHDFAKHGEPFDLDTRALPDGDHEFHIIAVGPEPIESRGGLSVPVTVANHGHAVTLRAVGEAPYRWGKKLTLEVEADEALGGAGVVVMQGTRRIGQVAGSKGSVEVDPRVFGVGPVMLRALALSPTGGAGDAVSKPLELYVEPSEPLPTYAIDPPGARAEPGVWIAVGDAKGRASQATSFDAALQAAQLKPGDSFRVVGLFHVDEDGLYQFYLRHAMELELRVDGIAQYRGTNEERALDYVPVALKRGLHKLEFIGKARENRSLGVRLGLRGVELLSPAAMTHIPK